MLAEVRDSFGWPPQPLGNKALSRSVALFLMLNRDHNPQLPEGETPFTADGVVCTGNFAKIALNVAHRAGQPGNVLADLLRSWFGADAGQPGTAQYVEMMPGEPHWQMRPTSPVASRGESIGGLCFSR